MCSSDLDFLIFKWLNNIPLCVYTHTHTHTHRHTHTHIYTTTLCFIHSSIHGHLSCFHVLAIVNNAAVNMEVQISFQVSALVSFVYIFRRGIAGSSGSSVFDFYRILHAVFHSGYTSLQSLSQCIGFPSLFSTSMPAFVTSCLSDDSHSNRHKIISYCGCDLHFPNDL